MSRADDLLQKAKQRGLGLSQEGLSPTEVEEILTELSSEDPHGPLYTYIQALGEGAGPELADTIEPFIHCKDNVLAYVALQVLCTDWNLTSRYVDDLIDFIRGVDWDIGDPDFPDRHVQGLAMSIGGRYVHQSKDPRVLDALFAAYEDIVGRARLGNARDALHRDMPLLGLAAATGHPARRLRSDRDPEEREEILARARILRDSLRRGDSRKSVL